MLNQKIPRGNYAMSSVSAFFCRLLSFLVGRNSIIINDETCSLLVSEKKDRRMGDVLTKMIGFYLSALLDGDVLFVKYVSFLQCLVKECN